MNDRFFFFFLQIRCGTFPYKTKREMNFCGKYAPHDIYATDGCIKMTFLNKNRFSLTGFTIRNNIEFEVKTVNRGDIYKTDCRIPYISNLLVFSFVCSFVHVNTFILLKRVQCLTIYNRIRILLSIHYLVSTITLNGIRVLYTR